MAQVEKSTSNGGKRYLTTGVVRFDDIETETLLADTISGGTLTMGGTANGNGIISVLDSSNALSVKLDNTGITLGAGRKIVGGDGILTNLVVNGNCIGFFMPGSFDDANSFVGYSTDGVSANWQSYLEFNVYIPSNFTISEAYVTLIHTPVYWDDGGTYALWGYARNLKLYKATSFLGVYENSAYLSEYHQSGTPTSTEVSNAFGVSGYTAPNPTGTGLTTITTSINVGTSLVSGYNKLIVKSSDAVPVYNPTYGTNCANIGAKTCYLRGIVNVIGYTK